jgi:Outer membrane protein Omp28/Secretion system C-terminal sorting domain
MKKFTMLLGAALLIGFAANETNAQGTRGRVVLEVFTGTWCGFCPGAALGTDDLIAKGKSISALQHHIADAYETPENAARDAYYAVLSYPTSWLDGKYEIFGEDRSTSIYPTYLPVYNTAIAEATPFDLTMSSTLAGNNLTVTYTASQVGQYSGGKLVAHVVVTESHIPENWGSGLTELNHVVRDMAPTADGTAFTVTMGGTFTGTETIALDPSWIQSNMEVVVFIQNSQTKEIFNSVLSPLLPSPYSVDPSISDLHNTFSAVSCDYTITPEFILHNHGNTALTSLDIHYNLNGTTRTYNWTGNVPFYFRALVSLPPIRYTPQATNSFTVSISNPNMGAVDQVSNNNTVSATWNRSPKYATGQYTLTLQLDRFGSQVRWEFLDGNGYVVSSGGPYVNTFSFGVPLSPPITGTAVYTSNDCAAFVIYDAASNGICCGHGNGSYKVVDPFGNTVASGGEFGASERTEWESDPSLADVRDLSAAIAVHPNPSDGNFTITLGKEISGVVNLAIMNLEGQVLFARIIPGYEYPVNLPELPSGAYLLRVRTEKGQVVKKLTIR